MRLKQINPQATRRRYHLYSPTALTNAYLAIRDHGMPVLRASRQYAVPETTLRDRVMGRIDPECVTTGRQPILSLEEESKIVNHLKKIASYGYGYSRQEVVDIATEYAVNLGKRNINNPLTIKWFERFIKRWPELRVIKPRSLEVARAKATSVNTITDYFNELQQTVTKYGLGDKPHLIFNVDEKGVTTEHTPPYIVSGKDFPAQAVTSGKGKTTTIIGCGSAIGQAIPPYFVFAGKRMMPDLMKDASAGAAWTVTDSGWSNSDVFKTYLQEHFLKFIPQHDGQHVLLLLDGHKSHVSVGLVEWALSKNIILFILPAHTSHILQPLDVGCFGPFQRLYNSECHKLMRQTSQTITRYNVCGLACKVYSHALSGPNLESSFRKTGIYPLNKSAIPNETLTPAEIFTVHDAVVGDDGSECADTVHDGSAVDRGNDEAEMELDTVESGMDDGRIVHVHGEKGCEHADDIFKRREDELRRVKSEHVKKARRTMSAVVSGRAITETSVRDRMVQHEVQQGRCSKGSGPNTAAKGKGKRVVRKSGKGKALVPRRFVNVDEPGPSGITNHRSDSDSDGQNTTLDDDLCCICKMVMPLELQACISLVYASWVKCDGVECPHWVHLRYCTPVTVVRRHDTFYCPHCRHEE